MTFAYINPKMILVALLLMALPFVAAIASFILFCVCFARGRYIVGSVLLLVTFLSGGIGLWMFF